MNRKGFTLVEILIVVVILAVLAAIVIPRYTQASGDARESALCGDLQTIRKQITLYRVQHSDVYPATFPDQLTNRTNQAGTVMPANGDPTQYPYGPYLRTFPTNGFVSGAAGSTVKVGTSCAYDGTTGWYFNTSTSKFTPNDNAKASHQSL